ncbi:hypothetical protein RhiirC2_798524 [Rhizophagus irregularis]|uniref:Uncharacterized protein n=1 Tax=Rhizophagus irregularis TaxID=588596 RepID=A0A2N1M6D3_9GLOM|nr:hypothetical protein RhiirC2_798524 [Rhizophagus irregularis]
MSEQRYEISTPLPYIDFLEEYNDEISSNDKFEREMLNKTLDNTNNLEHTELTPCVVIDFIKGEVQRCGESTKLRQLRNLFGTWQVDRDAINEVDGVLIRLGVCNTHFQFDNKGKSGTTCTTLHADDMAKGLEYLGNWLINIAQTGNDKEKNQKILTKAFEALLPFADLTFSSNSTITTFISTTLNEPPSLFMIKTLFIEFSKKQEIEKKLEIKEKELEKKEIEKKEIEKKLAIEDFEAASALESPQTIQEYYDGFPKFLNDFFFGVIDELYQKKMTVCNWQRKRRHKLPKTVISEPIMKTVTFITSMLLGLAFPHLKIWLP